MGRFFPLSHNVYRLQLNMGGNLKGNIEYMCFGDVCMIGVPLYPQFARMGVGVCGRLGRLAQWPVEKGRSPEYGTATLLYHSWVGKTAKGAGERLRAALPNLVQVSILAKEKISQKEASLLEMSAVFTCPTFSPWLPSGRHSPCALDWAAVSLSGSVEQNKLSLFCFVVSGSIFLFLQSSLFQKEKGLEND